MDDNLRSKLLQVGGELVGKVGEHFERGSSDWAIRNFTHPGPGDSIIEVEIKVKVTSKVSQPT